MDKQFLLELEAYLDQHRKNVQTSVEEYIDSNYEIMEESIFAEDTLEELSMPSTKREVQKNKIAHTKPYEECPTQGTPSFKRMVSYSKSQSDIEEYIRNSKNEETFSTKLLKHIDQIGLPDSEVYKKAGIDRRHFSKIRSNKEYQPKKQTVMALCLALKLKLEQAEEMLMLAGYSLSNSDTGDLVIKFCIEKGKYDLMEVNEVLEYFGAKGIGTTKIDLFQHHVL
jgi:DNA-binding phage protein